MLSDVGEIDTTEHRSSNWPIFAGSLFRHTRQALLSLSMLACDFCPFLRFLCNKTVLFSQHWLFSRGPDGNETIVPAEGVIFALRDNVNDIRLSYRRPDEKEWPFVLAMLPDELAENRKKAFSQTEVHNAAVQQRVGRINK